MFGDHGTSYWHGETHNYGILCDEILVDFGGDPCCRGNFIMLSFLTYDLNTTADISIVMYSVYIFFSIYTVPNIMLNAERDALFYISINHNYPTFLGLFFPLYEFEIATFGVKKTTFLFSLLLWRAIWGITVFQTPTLPPWAPWRTDDAWAVEWNGEHLNFSHVWRKTTIWVRQSMFW